MGYAQAGLEKEHQMNDKDIRYPPPWVFGLIAVGATWASGVFMGKMTLAGPSGDLLVRAVGYGMLALMMAWGAWARR
jgi:hypothetical protein